MLSCTCSLPRRCITRSMAHCGMVKSCIVVLLSRVKRWRPRPCCRGVRCGCRPLWAARQAQLAYVQLRATLATVYITCSFAFQNRHTTQCLAPIVRLPMTAHADNSPAASPSSTLHIPISCPAWSAREIFTCHRTSIVIRQVEYLHNMVEQDHRGVKQVTRPMWGVKSFDAAQSTLVGIELVHMLRKGQLAEGVEQGLSVAEQFYALAT
ncbi:MAG TPA: DDE-type integrase/transposase/recombinase [Candidatus Tectomicrobia bacterium]